MALIVFERGVHNEKGQVDAYYIYGGLWNAGVICKEYSGFLRGAGAISCSVGGTIDIGVPVGNRSKNTLWENEKGNPSASPFRSSYGL